MGGWGDGGIGACIAGLSPNVGVEILSPLAWTQLDLHAINQLGSHLFAVGGITPDQFNLKAFNFKGHARHS